MGTVSNGERAVAVCAILDPANNSKTQQMIHKALTSVICEWHICTAVYSGTSNTNTDTVKYMYITILASLADITWQ